MSNTAPLIYVPTPGPIRAPWFARLIAAAVAGAALTVLLVAAWLEPSSRGVGTHEALGMMPCAFLQRTGVPCAGCGMTTSFALLVRGRVIASFIAQPFGMILCLLTAAAFWAGLYIAITAKPAYRLAYQIPPKFHLLTWVPLALAAWLWKIALVSMGH
jgi:hypothetical protein